DARCLHALVEDVNSGVLVCCFRILPLASGAAITESYAAQSYDVTSLTAYHGKLLELGRFCIHPDWQDPDILRVAWGALTNYVDAEEVQLLFGCSSFNGVDAVPHAASFAHLHSGHLGPDQWRPGKKAVETIPLAQKVDLSGQNGSNQLPPLLRTYLMMGGWVSDHAVVDRDLGTLHVFTGVEIASIPPARKRLLRALAA
ncbi:MAG: GNAT family N-acetyltransferase, partial [Litoreibacter sp.]|nr:GNAT family N-acetyltransferase [Litoreibacter sp.]